MSVKKKKGKNNGWIDWIFFYELGKLAIVSSLIKQFDFKSLFLSSFIMNLKLAGFLQRMRVSLCPRIGLEQWLRCFDHLVSGAECTGHVQYLAFASDTLFCSQLSRSDSWVFWSFCIFSLWINPNCACMQLFLVSYSFFVFYCSRRH